MEIRINGMGCMHCVKKVIEALQAVGADVIRCEIGVAELSGVTRPVAEEAIRNAGFDPVEEAAS